MLGNLVTSTISLLDAKSASDTAVATGSWTLITNFEGAALVTASVGTVTSGNIAGAILHADDDSGGSSASVTTFTTVTTANDPKTETLTINTNGLKPYIQYKGTITTGPVQGVSCHITGVPKYV